ncbi:hypothetical protein Bbelb_046500 [Branchiostoma belcheri]|nr:hypothetical protein Bbelb_046500 [Branchiostoma belcheri]
MEGNNLQWRMKEQTLPDGGKPEGHRIAISPKSPKKTGQEPVEATIRRRKWRWIGYESFLLPSLKLLPQDRTRRGKPQLSCRRGVSKDLTQPTPRGKRYAPRGDKSSSMKGVIRSFGLS